jgi:hypothetical protein
MPRSRQPCRRKIAVGCALLCNHNKQAGTGEANYERAEPYQPDASECRYLLPAQLRPVREQHCRRSGGVDAADDRLQLTLIARSFLLAGDLSQFELLP